MSTWPQLKYSEWNETLDTLHLWTQIVGKLKLSHMPWVNHSWNSTFFVGARGFVSSGVCLGDRKFEANFDFLEHTLTLFTSDGLKEVIPLKAGPVAEFWSQFLEATQRLGIETNFVASPNERQDHIPFAIDKVHHSYDAKKVETFWRIIIHVDNLLQRFRAHFIGQSSPVHFFWGSFDLANSRFSGRRAPEHPGGIPHLPDLVTKEAYSHEVSSCGFWPGNAMFPHAAFYSYCYPEPQGFSDFDLGLQGAFYHPDLREFIFPYDEMLKHTSPEAAILIFFESAYEAAAKLGNWNRPELEESRFLRQLQNHTG